MEIRIDRKIYSDGCISKTVYALTRDFRCVRSLDGEMETIVMDANDSCISDEEMSKLFWQTLNDYKTREIIAVETKDIRTILYAKAFADCDEFDETVGE